MFLKMFTEKAVVIPKADGDSMEKNKLKGDRNKLRKERKKLDKQAEKVAKARQEKQKTSDKIADEK